MVTENQCEVVLSDGSGIFQDDTVLSIGNEGLLNGFISIKIVSIACSSRTVIKSQP